MRRRPTSTGQLPEAHRRGGALAVVTATLGGAVPIYLFSMALGAIGVEIQRERTSAFASAGGTP